jgi:hypothetical protein
MRIVCFLLTAVALVAQTPKFAPEIQALVEMTNAAPPEIAADALLRIVESGKVSEEAGKRDLIERAFRLAAGATFKLPMHAAPGVNADSRPGVLSKAYALKLDALSLQSRAVNAMLAIDRPRARAMFLDAPRPSPERLTCDRPLVYDVSPYYKTLAAIVNNTFSDRERAKQEHINLFLDSILRIASPAELAPAAAAIKVLNVSADEHAAIVTRFNGILANLWGDDRSFSASIDDLNHEVTPEMAAAFAKYSLKHLTAARCEDSVQVTAAFAGPGARAAKIEGRAKAEPYWQSEPAKRIVPLATALRSASPPERKEQFAELLKNVADWNASSENSEADFYHQKAMVFLALTELAPTGQDRDHLVADYVAFVGNSGLQQQSPAEWFLEPRDMLERVRNTNNGEPAKLLEAYASSGNPVLVLYAALERTFATNRPSWVPAGAGAN